ncbi:hypothetical protein DL93DRAFT_2157442 [Clavulina sp. PMI_390]|nr:hypothetical protein DL93DRAFT_2157442 [Clavulina sp. PMI_390]
MTQKKNIVLTISLRVTESQNLPWRLQTEFLHHQDGYGTRPIPPGDIKGAHCVRTPYYIQVTGVGDLTSMNIPKGDDGGKLDPHEYDGLGNPIGGLEFGTPYNGTLRHFHEWTNFMSTNYFCFRVRPDGPLAPTYCKHASLFPALRSTIHVLGSGWSMPGNYSDGFSSCEGDPTQPMGDPSTPSAHPVAKSSSCTYFATLSAYNDNAPAATPTASLRSDNVSASFSRVSVTSVAAMSSECTASVASVTSIASTSKPTGGSSPTSTTSSHTGAAPASIDRGSLMATLISMMGLTNLLFGFWAISRI